MRLTNNNDRNWWKNSVVYQIYPRSFMDSNDDGIGDLQGIISKLDYLKDLGVDVIWLSPCYESPNDDNGYDISDYQGIMKEFGSMNDWEQMIEQMHIRGIKLIMDLVVNHTSDEHKWFKESRKSKDNEYREYYIWRKGKKDREPNNWTSFFGGSAWQYDEVTDEYYLHLFSKKQPDLNWENEKLRQEIYDMMSWWLKKGVDGFRMDVINVISKTEGLPSAGDENEYTSGEEYFINGPRVHEFLQEMNEKVFSKYNILTVGETINITTDDAIMYTDENRDELNMLFSFELVDIDNGNGGKWDRRPFNMPKFKEVIVKWQNALSNVGWNSLFLNNHDMARLVSRFGNDTEYRIESAKMFATVMHLLKGTPYIYQGEEIGMTNVKFDTISDYRDIETLNFYNENSRIGVDEEKIMGMIHMSSRDNARTPMQWDSSKNAGFTSGIPWIKVNSNYHEINVENSNNDSNSILSYYKELIAFRKNNTIVVHGDFTEIACDNDNVFAYTRKYNDETLVIISNSCQKEVVTKLSLDKNWLTYEVVLNNYNEYNLSENLRLKPYQVLVLMHSSNGI